MLALQKGRHVVVNLAAERVAVDVQNVTEWCMIRARMSFKL
jgi:hypothetical protein